MKKKIKVSPVLMGILKEYRDNYDATIDEIRQEHPDWIDESKVGPYVFPFTPHGQAMMQQKIAEETGVTWNEDGYMVLPDGTVCDRPVI